MSLLIPIHSIYFFFFNDTATTEIYPLSLHDALPIWPTPSNCSSHSSARARSRVIGVRWSGERTRSEEHTSELQSLAYLVCRLLLEKKKKKISVSVHDYGICTSRSEYGMCVVEQLRHD